MKCTNKKNREYLLNPKNWAIFQTAKTHQKIIVDKKLKKHFKLEVSTLTQSWWFLKILSSFLFCALKKNTLFSSLK